MALPWARHSRSNGRSNKWTCVLLANVVPARRPSAPSFTGPAGFSNSHRHQAFRGQAAQADTKHPAFLSCIKFYVNQYLHFKQQWYLNLGWLYFFIPSLKATYRPINAFLFLKLSWLSNSTGLVDEWSLSYFLIALNQPTLLIEASLKNILVKKKVYYKVAFAFRAWDTEGDCPGDSY